MKIVSILISIFLVVTYGQVLAQGSLHVKGKIKSDSLANSGYLVIIADSTGTLDTLPPGQAGQVLISNGPGAKPYWGVNSGAAETYIVNATRVTINTTHPTFTQITGLSKSITLTDSATINIFTYGSIHGIGNTVGRSNCFIQVFRDSAAISTASQSATTFNSVIPTVAVESWAIMTSINLSSGTYLFDVRACKYGTSDDFYAGGNASSPVLDQGALIIQVFY